MGFSRENLRAPVPQLLGDSAQHPLAHQELLPRTVCDTHCALSVAPVIVQEKSVLIYFLPFLDHGFLSLFLFPFLFFFFPSSFLSFPSSMPSVNVLVCLFVFILAT